MSIFSVQKTVNKNTKNLEVVQCDGTEISL